MMPVTTFVKPSTPISTVSSSGAPNTTTAVQSGPYTKAQFLNTMEGSRSVKNIKEIEQLLRDYPAALELYRTKKYKVKVKYEADVERVILVEKRSSKNAANNGTKSHDFQQNKQSIHEVSNEINRNKDDGKNVKDLEQSRSHTHSQDRIIPAVSATENSDPTQTTATSSNHVTNNAQAKADQNQIPSKERDSLATSRSKQDQQSSGRRDRSHDSRSNASHTKYRGKKNSRDYGTAMVPYVPKPNPPGNVWQQSRALQPYYHNPAFQHQQQYRPNYYMPSQLVAQQNPLYQQPYYYPQQPRYPLVYQQQSAYPAASQLKSAGNITNPALHSAHNYPPSSQTMYNSNYGAALPPSFHTFHPTQQHYQNPQPMAYPPQIPYQMPVPWPQAVNRPADPAMNNANIQMESRRNSKHRAHSVDTGPRAVPPVPNYYQPQQQAAAAAAIIEQQYHHHRHHHHHHPPPAGVAPTDAQVNNVAATVDTAKQQNISFKEPMVTINNDNHGEKLTIRQLNEIFVQMDPTGRLPYTSVPNVLQRYGMILAENDLMAAAQDLKYNVAEPISARRLVHVLVKLGKIAKSNNQQRPPQLPQPLGSPAILPEDREVTDIMTQRRATGIMSTHIHSSAYPNYWY